MAAIYDMPRERTVADTRLRDCLRGREFTRCSGRAECLSLRRLKVEVKYVTPDDPASSLNHFYSGHRSIFLIPRRDSVYL